MTSVQTGPAITATTHYINGCWSEHGARTFSDRNPFNGEVVAEIATGGAAEAEAAVAAANAAFPAWAAMPPIERQRLFLKAADVTERRLPMIVHSLAIETGSSAAFANFQVQWSINLLRQAASWGSASRSAWLPALPRGTARSTWHGAPRFCRWRSATRWS